MIKWNKLEIKTLGGELVVSGLSIFFMIFSMGISLLLPLILVIYFRKKYQISYRPLFVGAAIWFIFSQILEKMLHMVVIKTPLYSMAVPFAIYAALAAGVFEETGRFVAFKFFLKENTEWEDGIAYGIGHGGIEAILLGFLLNLNNLIYSLSINNGTYDKLIGSKLPENVAANLKETLISISPFMFGISGLERAFALVLHIGMTLVILYGIQKRKNLYLIYAIILHAIFDFLPALYQMKVITNLVLVESAVAVMSVIVLFAVVKTKGMFHRETIVRNI